MYGNNDWRDYLAHSWGTSPKQKAREKEYNHEYWEKNKEEIMAKRRKRLGQEERDPENDYEINRNILQDRRWANGEDDFKGSTIDSKESLEKRLQEEIDHIKKLIAANEQAGGYADGDMANIKKHNEMILENLTKLAEQAKGEADSYSGDQQKEFFSKINDQFNKAHELILDTGKKSTNEYLSNIGVNRTSSNSSSGSNSSSSSEKSSSKDKGTDADAYNKARDLGRGQQRSGKYANDKNYQSLMDDYRLGRPHNDVHDDLGEFIDEYGGDLDKPTIDAWVAFRKELGYDTSPERINTERQEAKARKLTGTVGTVKKENDVGTRQSGTESTSSTRHPRSREKNITGNGSSVYRRGIGSGNGGVGNVTLSRDNEGYVDSLTSPQRDYERRRNRKR